jgi:hypothetical protein
MAKIRQKRGFLSPQDERLAFFLGIVSGKSDRTFISIKGAVPYGRWLV